MLAEVAAVSPQEYERQQKDDLASSGGVRNTARFVEALADRHALSPWRHPWQSTTNAPFCG